MELTETNGISEAEAARLINRAVEIDTRDAPLSATQLREVALESGISSAAFEQALSEMREESGASRKVERSDAGRSTRAFWKRRTLAAVSGALLITLAVLGYVSLSGPTASTFDELQDATIRLSCLSEGDAALVARNYLPKGSSTLKWNATREPGVLYMHAPAQSIRQFREKLAAVESDGATICATRPSR